jgi:quercetin dioxygenase-like cupin family protein
MSPTVARKTLAAGEGMSQMIVKLKGGSVLPAHAHVNEQIVHVISGKLKLTVDGVLNEINPGESLLLKSNVPHGAAVDVDTVVLDTFNPPREDLLKVDREAMK